MGTDVLFVCVHNAGRSVMAEAIFNARAAGRMRAVSAGTTPAERPHPVVVEALAEIGIDASGHRGRVITDAMVGGASRVITMGCGIDEKECPAIRYSLVEDWALADPKGRPLEEVRSIRDDIKRRVSDLLAELGIA